MSTPVDVAALRALAEAATEGPWRVKRDADYAELWSIPGPTPVVGSRWEPDEGLTPDDAEFIAAARNDLPALLDEVERHRAFAAHVLALAGWWDTAARGNVRRGDLARAEMRKWCAADIRDLAAGHGITDALEDGR